MAERLRGIMSAVNRAGCAGAIGVGLGFLLAGVFGLLVGPHVFRGWRGPTGSSVGYMVAGSLFLLVSGLRIVLRARQP